MKVGRWTDRAAEARRAKPDLSRERCPEGANFGDTDRLELELREGIRCQIISATAQRASIWRKSAHLPAGLEVKDLRIPSIPVVGRVAEDDEPAGLALRDKLTSKLDVDETGDAAVAQRKLDCLASDLKLILGRLLGPNG